jgi:hypothetical protein
MGVSASSDCLTWRPIGAPLAACDHGCMVRVRVMMGYCASLVMASVRALIERHSVSIERRSISTFVCANTTWWT